LVLRLAARLCGLRNFNNYVILGDDIVFVGTPELANKYSEIMNKFGVSISQSKTHCSKNMFEFAKRWYNHDINISGVPINAFMSSIDKYFIVTDEILKLLQG
jgi:hypothetical protein